MKRLFKSLSIILIMCIILPLFCCYENVNAAQNRNNNVNIVSKEKRNEKYKFPDIVDEHEVNSRGYVGRHKDQEKDLYSFVFENEDGSKTMRVYSHPVKYIDKGGEAKDISLKIKKGSYGTFTTSEHEIITTFESELKEGISLEYEDVDITMIPTVNNSVEQSKTVATMEEDERTVSYKVDDITTFEYELTYAGFKEDIVVNEYNGQTEYSFILQTNGLKLCEEYGSYYLVDYDGKVKATIGDIVIFTADEANNTMGTMTYEVIKPNYEYELTIHVDGDYLKDEKTVYPIRIDPTVEINYSNKGAGAIEDVTINSKTTYSGAAGSLYVGRHSNGSISRILMKFPNLDMPVPFAPMIISAQVELRDLMCQDNEEMNIYCYEYNNTSPTWSETVTTTNSSVGSSYVSTFLDNNYVSYGKGNVEKQRYAFDITSLAKKWADGVASPNKGIVFTATPTFENATGSSAKNWYKTFASYNRSAYKPSLTIKYETRAIFTFRNAVNGSYYLRGTNTTSSYLNFIASSDTKNGNYIWCIEYLPTYDAFNIVAMGLRYSKGTGAYALYNMNTTVGLGVQSASNPYMRYKPVRASSTSYHFKNAVTGYYLARSTNSNNLTVSSTMSSYSLFNMNKIETRLYNNFYSGTYTRGIYDGVAHIKLRRGSSLQSCDLFKNNDLSAALSWNGITDKVIIYGPNDAVPAGITPLYVTIEACDLSKEQGGAGYGVTVPNGYTYAGYKALSESKQIEILSSDWSSVTIYLNNATGNSNPFRNISDINDRNLMINKTIAHEMGHVLKLAHLNQTDKLHTFTGARGGYTVEEAKKIYSIMHQGKPWDSTNGKVGLISAIIQDHDMINLVSKWEYHQDCTH